METKCFRDPLIERKIKVAVCSPFEAAQIMESTATPSSRLVKWMTSKGFCLEEIDRDKDPDHAKYLLWAGETPDLVVLAMLADQLGELLGKTILLTKKEDTWQTEVEAYYKTEIFRKILRILKLQVKFSRTEGEFSFTQYRKQRIVRTRICDSETIRKESFYEGDCTGLFGKSKSGQMTIWINEQDRSEDHLALISTLFHEVVHLKQKIHRRYGIGENDKNFYSIPPEMDADIFAELFENALNSLL